MIEGVEIKKLVTHPDDRGCFNEILRDDDKLLAHFGQASITTTYPGVIKAFHWHEKQDDLWYVVSGMAQVVLHDRRDGSPTQGQTNVIYAGDQNQVLIKIPVGVLHGYRVIGPKPVTLIYFTTKSYVAADPDELRVAFDDPAIGFDWSTKNR